MHILVLVVSFGFKVEPASRSLRRGQTLPCPVLGNFFVLLGRCRFTFPSLRSGVTIQVMSDKFGLLMANVTRCPVVCGITAWHFWLCYGPSSHVEEVGLQPPSMTWSNVPRMSWNIRAHTAGENRRLSSS